MPWRMEEVLDDIPLYEEGEGLSPAYGFVMMVVDIRKRWWRTGNLCAFLILRTFAFAGKVLPAFRAFNGKISLVWRRWYS